MVVVLNATSNVRNRRHAYEFILRLSYDRKFIAGISYACVPMAESFGIKNTEEYFLTFRMRILIRAVMNFTIKIVCSDIIFLEIGGIVRCLLTGVY